jgi:CPA1 family monovalent cation:H+ antiporter
LQRSELPSWYFNEENKKQASGKIFDEFSKLQLEIIAAGRQILTTLHTSGKVNEEIWLNIE